jgi:hypothetical protein
VTGSLAATRTGWPWCERRAGHEAVGRRVRRDLNRQPAAAELQAKAQPPQRRRESRCARQVPAVVAKTAEPGDQGQPRTASDAM